MHNRPIKSSYCGVINAGTIWDTARTSRNINNRKLKVGGGICEPGWTNETVWKWNNRQHVTSVGQRKNLSPWQDSNLWPPKHRRALYPLELRRTHGERSHILGSYLTCVLHTARISDDVHVLLCVERMKLCGERTKLCFLCRLMYIYTARSGIWH